LESAQLFVAQRTISENSMIECDAWVHATPQSAPVFQEDGVQLLDLEELQQVGGGGTANNANY